MKRSKKLILMVLCTLLMIFITACGSDTIGQNTSQQEEISLTVLAAASLTDVMEEIKMVYEKANENISITYSFASSGSLQQQIEQGAPADVFISASTKQMDALEEEDFIIVETRKEFLENKIVLVVHESNTTVSDFQDLKFEDVKVVALGEPESVPVGQYADEVLTNLGILEDIQSKVVYAKDVREVLTWVETENADVGMVYSTDAQISENIKVVATASEGTHEAIYYPAAVISDSENIEAAINFSNFLYGSEAQPVFEKYGFTFIPQ
ncbi:MAG: molybdate ABC transporter substrate-binding protein [Eubacteriales bacterium]